MYGVECTEAAKNLPKSEQTASGKIPIIVPESFEEYVMSERECADVPIIGTE